MNLLELFFVALVIWIIIIPVNWCIAGSLNFILPAIYTVQIMTVLYCIAFLGMVINWLFRRKK